MTDWEENPFTSASPEEAMMLEDFVGRKLVHVQPIVTDWGCGGLMLVFSGGKILSLTPGMAECESSLFIHMNGQADIEIYHGK